MSGLEKSAEEKAAIIKEGVCSADNEDGGLARARMAIYSRTSVDENDVRPEMKDALAKIGVKAEGYWTPIESSGRSWRGLSVGDMSSVSHLVLTTKCDGDDKERKVSAHEYSLMGAGHQRIVMDSQEKQHDTFKDLDNAAKKIFAENSKELSPAAKELADKLFNATLQGTSIDNLRILAKAALKNPAEAQAAISAVNATFGKIYEFTKDEKGNIDGLKVNGKDGDYLKLNSWGTIKEGQGKWLKPEDASDPWFFNIFSNSKYVQESAIRSVPQLAAGRVLYGDLSWEPRPRK